MAPTEATRMRVVIRTKSGELVRLLGSLEMDFWGRQFGGSANIKSCLTDKIRAMGRMPAAAGPPHGVANGWNRRTDFSYKKLGRVAPKI